MARELQAHPRIKDGMSRNGVAAGEGGRPACVERHWLKEVRNRGSEAAERHALRGEITHGGVTKVEPTAYRGSHWVECYIVKNGVCVAHDHHPVIIR
jgi:hypothetical protein